MTKILFICHGNICRSPMAEFVMKDLVRKAGLEESFYIESAATSREELGNPVYPPARRQLAEHGISCQGKTARQLTREDYQSFDLLVGMDWANLRNMERICGGDPQGKLHLLLDYTVRPGQVADPWYTGDFDLSLIHIFHSGGGSSLGGGWFLLCGFCFFPCHNESSFPGYVLVGRARFPRGFLLCAGRALRQGRGACMPCCWIVPCTCPLVSF